MIVYIPSYWPSETYQDQIRQLYSEKKRMHSMYLKCVNWLLESGNYYMEKKKGGHIMFFLEILKDIIVFLYRKIHNWILIFFLEFST
jgi:hypothetical protein